MNYVYLLLLFASFVVPFAMSFEKKISFISKYTFYLPTITFISIFFIIWDIVLTARGVWAFNDSYITGLKLFGLPIEEILFFFVIPYIAIFMYEVTKYYFKLESYLISIRITTFVLAIFLLILCFTKTSADYTFYTFTITAIVLFLTYKKKNENITYYFATYLLMLLPFLIVNGFLTKLPIVIYNDSQNLSIRIYSIPIEDFIYLMLLMFSNFWLYDYLKTRKLGVKKK